MTSGLLTPRSVPASGAAIPARRRHPRRNRRGLIGVLLAVVVTVIIIIGIFAVYNNVNTSVQSAQTATFVRQLVPQATRFYRGDFTGFDATRAIRSGWVPEDWQSSDTAIEDPRGNDVAIASANSNRSFTMTFDDGVTTETCESVLSALKSEPRFEKVTIDGTGKDEDAVDTPAEIATACADAEDNDFVLQFK